MQKYYFQKTASFWFVSIFFSIAASANTNYYYNNGKKIEVNKLQERRVVQNESVTYYQTAQGYKIGVSNEIIVKCSDGVNCIQLLQQKGFTDISSLSKELFLLKVDLNDDVFAISNTLHEDKNISFAHPNFLKEKKRR